MGGQGAKTSNGWHQIFWQSKDVACMVTSYSIYGRIACFQHFKQFNIYVDVQSAWNGLYVEDKRMRNPNKQMN